MCTICRYNFVLNIAVCALNVCIIDIHANFSCVMLNWTKKTLF